LASSAPALGDDADRVDAAGAGLHHALLGIVMSFLGHTASAVADEVRMRACSASADVRDGLDGLRYWR
jgi:hypothetical protein